MNSLGIRGLHREQLVATVACRVCGGLLSRAATRADGADVLDCQRCGAGNVSPVPRRENVHLLYPDAYFDLGAEASTARHGDVDILLAEGSLRGRRVLDLGCGTGMKSALMRRLGADVWGVEGDPRFAAAAAQKLEVGHVRQAQLDEPWSFPQTFGLVTAYAVIEHLWDPRVFAANIGAALGPGGTLLLSTPNYDARFVRRYPPNDMPWFKSSLEHLVYFGPRALDALFEPLSLRRRAAWVGGVRQFEKLLRRAVGETYSHAMPLYPLCSLLYRRARARLAPPGTLGGNVLYVIFEKRG